MKLINRLRKHEHIFVPIIYGLLNKVGNLEVAQKKIISGGCILPDHDLHFGCLICGEERVYRRMK